MSGTPKIDDVVFYPFSPGIPWQTENGIIKPAITKAVWKEIVSAKKAYVLCPGFLVEILLLILFDSTLKRNGINIESYIVPKKYNSILKHFKMKTKSAEESEDLFIEFERLREAVEAYPAPVFMDRKNNIYFNSLFNYGEVFDANANLQDDRNVEPFWKQVLKNTCCFPYDSSFKWFDKNILKKMSKKVLTKFGIDHTKPYILIDNNYISYNTADMRTSIAKTLAPHQLKSVGATFGYKQYQCVVSSNRKQQHGYFVNNTRIIPSWYDMDLFDWLMLVSLSSGIYSSDPNIYLSAAIIGCEKIFAGGNYDFGWELKDIADITTFDKKRKWTQKDEFSTSDIVAGLI